MGAPWDFVLSPFLLYLYFPKTTPLLPEYGTLLHSQSISAVQTVFGIFMYNCPFKQSTWKPHRNLKRTYSKSMSSATLLNLHSPNCTIYYLISYPWLLPNFPHSAMFRSLCSCFPKAPQSICHFPSSSPYPTSQLQCLLSQTEQIDSDIFTPTHRLWLLLNLHILNCHSNAKTIF